MREKWTQNDVESRATYKASVSRARAAENAAAITTTAATAISLVPSPSPPSPEAPTPGADATAAFVSAIDGGGAGVFLSSLVPSRAIQALVDG